MKTAISIADDVFALAERLAERLKMSRSELYTRAVRQFIAENSRKDLTRKLNEVYSEEPSALPPSVAEGQSASLPEEDW